jgi:deazaflavin-dependent oxidoreductase (nitroreductase family)
MVARNKGKPSKRSPLRGFVVRNVLPYGALLSVLTVAVFRLKVRPIIDVMRTLNKHIANPRVLKLAGRRHFFVTIIRHTGRRSGREYATPVVAMPTSDGFIIDLPYGEGVDWLKNVLAASRAKIEAKGETWEVVEPEVVDWEVVQPFLPWVAWLVLYKLGGIKRYVTVRRLRESPSATVGDGGTRTTLETPG